MRRLRSGPAPLGGTIEVPGDKSISHRALIVAALASGPSVIEGSNAGGDVRSTAAALDAWGIPVRRDEDNGQVDVEGRGWDGFAEPADALDLGNSGTSIRLLAGVAAGLQTMTVLTGDETLRRRPMLRVVAPLRQMGAHIDGRSFGDLAPLTIRGGGLEGIDHELPMASAQVKSALLLAGLNATGTTTVIEPGRSRDHTERMLATAGAGIDTHEGSVTIRGGTELNPIDRVVPGDLSSALFLIVAAALLPGSELTVAGVGLNPTRTGALDVLRAMGADLVYEVTDDRSGEPAGTVMVRAGSLRGITIAGDVLPTLIDEIPILAVAATQAEGETVIADAAELRVKESDRLRALASELTKLGASVEETPDGLVIKGPTPLMEGAVESHGDHRIALALAIAGVVSEAKVRVAGWSCVDTSFPEFLDVLGRARSSKS